MDTNVHSQRVEIVGLNQRNAGRTCSVHRKGCGMALRPGDYVQFESSTYTNEFGVQMPCTKCLLLDEWTPTCTVGMLSSIDRQFNDRNGCLGLVAYLKYEGDAAQRRQSHSKHASAIVNCLNESMLQLNSVGVNAVSEVQSLKSCVFGTP
ncbi:hypothetical protein HDU77_009978 [Chytriomyces hyalinus]|nr:hypothetical protein HDU77_009978 [Chytriomyces hyalinus]